MGMYGSIKDAAGQMSAEQIKTAVRDAHTKHVPVAKAKAAQSYDTGKQYLSAASTRCHDFWTSPEAVQCFACACDVTKDIFCCLASCAWSVVVAVAPAGCCPEQEAPQAGRHVLNDKPAADVLNDKPATGEALLLNEKPVAEEALKDKPAEA